MHFHSHPLSLVYLSFNLCPSLHTQTCLKLVRVGSKFAVNTRLSWGLLKSLSASVHQCDVFLYLTSLVVSAARRSLCGNHCLLCHPLPLRKSRWLSLTLCDCGCLCVIARLATAASTRVSHSCFHVLRSETAGARLCCPVDEVCPIPCLEKKSRKRGRERDSRGVCVCASFWDAHTLLIFSF